MSDSIKEETKNIEAAIGALASAYKNAQSGLQSAYTEAFSKGGTGGVADVQSTTSLERFNAEVAGALKAAGMSAVLLPGAPIVPDFGARWALRVERGELETKRGR